MDLFIFLAHIFFIGAFAAIGFVAGVNAGSHDSVEILKFWRREE